MVLKVNLNRKLFGFFVNAVVIIEIMVGAVYFSAFREFENYAREFERERFEKLQEYWRMNIQILKVGRQILFTLKC